MKPICHLKWFVPSVVLFLAVSLSLADEPIDWSRARELYEKRQRGETLTTEEQTYLERARKQRAAGSKDTRSKRDQTNASPGEQPARHCTPLDELAQEKYQGEEGGLYGGGRNDPPKALLAPRR